MRDLTLVFDLDGTLVDTAPDLIEATNHVLAGKNLSPVEPALIRQAISFGALAMIKAGLKAHQITLPREELDNLFHQFLEYYAANIARLSRPFPGLIDVLRHCQGEGVRLAVCTNKREDLSRRLLEALDLAPRFKVIAGRDSFPVCKPDPGHLTRTIELAGGRTGHAIMIGDSQTDIATAKAAAIPVIGVTFGYSERPMRELQPTAVIDSYEEFLDTVNGFIKCGIKDTYHQG